MPPSESTFLVTTFHMIIDLSLEQEAIIWKDLPASGAQAQSLIVSVWPPLNLAYKLKLD
jgi:hypothetical protein